MCGFVFCFVFFCFQDLNKEDSEIYISYKTLKRLYSAIQIQRYSRGEDKGHVMPTLLLLVGEEKCYDLIFPNSHPSFHGNKQHVLLFCSFTSAKEVMFQCRLLVCLFVCLSACKQDFRNPTEVISMKFGVGV